MVEAWKEMEIPFDGLSDTYKEIAGKKETDAGPLEEGEEYLEKIDSEYEAFNKALGDFIAEIDNIRSGTPSPQSQESSAEETEGE